MKKFSYLFFVYVYSDISAMIFSAVIVSIELIFTTYACRLEESSLPLRVRTTVCDGNDANAACAQRIK